MNIYLSHCILKLNIVRLIPPKARANKSGINYMIFYFIIHGKLGYSSFRRNAFLRIFTVAFLRVLASAGALTLRGQLPNTAGQSPNQI